MRARRRSSAILRLTSRVVSRSRSARMRMTRYGWLWSAGLALSVVYVALQLVPLPQSVLRVTSPESARMWRVADRIASLAGSEVRSFHPISIDPAETAVQLFRVAAYAATFFTSMLLVRTARRRLALVIVLALVAM